MDGRQSQLRISGWVIALLALATFINYADRGSLSVASPLLKDTLAISNGQMGILLSAFFWTYALAQPLAGALTHRIDVRVVLAGGLALWACATLLSGFASSFATLLGLRALLGIGESVMFPANARIVACVPEHLRGRSNGFIAAAMALGPSAGTLAGGLILAALGWRAVFFALGAASLLWLLPWLTVPKLHGADSDQEAQDVEEPGYVEILGQRALWGTAIGHFCANYQYYLLLTWLPLFLVKSAHFSLFAMAWIGGGVFAAQSLASLVGGMMSDSLVRRGGSATLVRKGFILTGVVGCGAALLMASNASQYWVVLWLVLAGASQGVISPMIFTIGQTLAGPSAGGRWIGVQNLVGNLAGILAPVVTGYAVDWTGSFQGALIIAAAMSVFGVVAWGLVIGRVEPIAWRLGGLLPAKA
jgi:MFS family permease